MDRPAVSVVLPCHNGAATLDEAVASIRNQTFEDWELVLVDDGSDDGTPVLCREAAADDPRIRVLSPGRVGIVEALRLGCTEARGAFLARMDADDVARPERLARQRELMNSDPAMALCGTQVRMVGDNIGVGRRRYAAWINALVTPEDMAREMFVECPVPHPTFFMRRDVYDAIGGYEGWHWPEDYDLVLRFHQAGYRIGKAPEVLLDWREGSRRLSMNDPRYAERAFREIKRHFLFASYLAEGRPLYQWGAGEVGKRWLREWGDRGPVAVVDINPRKIGRRIHHTDVIAPEALPRAGACFVVIMVGAPGARKEIREWLAPRGYVETKDYLFVA